MALTCGAKYDFGQIKADNKGILKEIKDYGLIMC